MVLDVERGRFHVTGAPQPALSWGDLASKLDTQGRLPELSAEVDFQASQPTFPFGAHVAVVEVDTETGSVQLKRIVAVDDAGRIINPLVAEGQVHGGVAAGIAQALFEELAYDADGNPQNANLVTYCIPAASELPPIEVVNMETPTPINPLGAKGIGESGTIGSTPAVHNAVIDALAPYGVRHLQMPLNGETVIDDQVQGRVVWHNENLDDLVLLRSDGTPTYMLAVVVDDRDMDVTHIIRGDDHLTNAARQKHIYDALGWKVPVMAHIPLIHGPDGSKLSKRHGALGVDAYRAMGYLPAAMRNYLVRLGWSHGDQEIFSTEELLAYFDLPQIGRSAARFDFAKLESLNGHYIRQSSDADLLGATEFQARDLVLPIAAKALETALAGRKKGGTTAPAAPARTAAKRPSSSAGKRKPS